MAVKKEQKVGVAKAHCAKSHRPFELFVKENCELWNEAKMNVTIETSSARDASAQPSLH